MRPSRQGGSVPFGAGSIPQTITASDNGIGGVIWSILTPDPETFLVQNSATGTGGWVAFDTPSGNYRITDISGTGHLFWRVSRADADGNPYGVWSNTVEANYP